MVYLVESSSVELGFAGFDFVAHFTYIVYWCCMYGAYSELEKEDNIKSAMLHSTPVLFSE